MIQYRDVRKQYLVSMIMYLIVFSHGNTMNWILTNTKAKKTAPTYIQFNQIGLFRSYAGGHVYGAIISLFMKNSIGLRLTVFMLMIPQTIYWLIISMADDVGEHKIASMLSGLVAAGTVSTMPLYIAEIADRRHRGALILMIFLFRTLGQMFYYILGQIIILPSRSLSFAFVWLNSSFFFVYLHTPETPLHHLRKKEFKKAEESWAYFNLGNRKLLTANERFRMKRALAGQMAALRATQIQHTWRVFTSPANLWNVVICVVLDCCSSFSCLVGIRTSTTMLYGLGDEVVSRNRNAYLVSLVELAGSALGILLVDRVGRRALVIVSSSIALLSASLLTLYTPVNHVNDGSEPPQMITFISMMLLIIAACSGMISITMLNVAELFDLQVCYYSAAVVALSRGFFKYSALCLFYIFHNYYGLYWSYLMHVIGCLGCLVISIFWLPESIGRELFRKKSEKIVPKENTEAISSSGK